MTRPAPKLIGIVNVTPDSFSDGGAFFDAETAVAHGLRLLSEGAAILDIGGESTRPGAAPVAVEEELSRVIPVIERLKGSGAIMSVDTRHFEVMAAGLRAGARMINDVSAFIENEDGLRLAAESGCDICLMHMKGDPRTMQDRPFYEDVFAEVFAFLEARINAAVAAGVDRARIVIDPGIGFGKTLDHNLILLNRLADFRQLGVRVMLGASRKRFISEAGRGAGPADRLPGSLAAALAGVDRGVDLLRVHDVAATVQALAVHAAIRHVSQ